MVCPINEELLYIVFQYTKVVATIGINFRLAGNQSPSIVLFQTTYTRRVPQTII